MLFLLTLDCSGNYLRNDVNHDKYHVADVGRFISGSPLHFRQFLNNISKKAILPTLGISSNLGKSDIICHNTDVIKIIVFIAEMK